MVRNRGAVQCHVGVVCGVYTLPRMEPVVLADVVSLAPWLLYVLPRQVLQDHQRRRRRLVVRQQVYGLHWTRGAHYKRTSFF